MSSEPNRKAAYSTDLRSKVVYQRLGRDLSLSDIASNLNISIGTVHNILKHFELTGEVAAKVQRFASRKLNASEELFVISLVLDRPNIYLQEVCDEVLAETGVTVSIPTVCRLLKRHGLTRKKIRQVSIQRNIQYRAEFMADILQYRKEQLVWVDEMGSNCKDTIRKNGYAIKGETPTVYRLLERGQRITAIAALTVNGIIAVQFTKDNVDGNVFYDFVRSCLIPNMHQYDGITPKSIVVLDNCSIHHVFEVTELFQQVGIMVIYLPPYSPDFNPIESTFSYVKGYLKKHDGIIAAMRDHTALIKDAFDNITSELAQSWITDCGY